MIFKKYMVKKATLLDMNELYIIIRYSFEQRHTLLEANLVAKKIKSRKTQKEVLNS